MNMRSNQLSVTICDLCKLATWLSLALALFRFRDDCIMHHASHHARKHQALGWDLEK